MWAKDAAIEICQIQFWELSDLFGLWLKIPLSSSGFEEMKFLGGCRKKNPEK